MVNVYELEGYIELVCKFIGIVVDYIVFVGIFELVDEVKLIDVILEIVLIWFVEGYLKGYEGEVLLR